MWANSFWGLLGFSVTFGVAVLLLSPDQLWLRPYFEGACAACGFASVVVLFWPLRHGHNRKKVRDSFRHPVHWVVKTVQPYHVILLGILIALAGVVWQYRHAGAAPDVSAITSPLQAQIDSLKQQLVDARKTKIANIPQANSNAIVEGSPPSKRYTAYEKEQRLRAIDEIYDTITTQLQPTYKEGQKIIDDLYKTADVNAEKQLPDYLAKVQLAFDNLNRLLKKYNYFTDIVELTKKNTFNDVEATHGAGNLVVELRDLRAKVPNDVQWFLLRDTTMMDARNQLKSFETYIAETLRRLQDKRAEIERAEVYTAQ